MNQVQFQKEKGKTGGFVERDHPEDVRGFRVLDYITGLAPQTL